MPSERDSFKHSYGKRISAHRYATLAQIEQMNKPGLPKVICYRLLIVAITAFCLLCVYKIDIKGEDTNMEAIAKSVVTHVSNDDFEQMLNSSVKVGQNIRDGIRETVHSMKTGVEQFDDKFKISESIAETVTTTWTTTTKWVNNNNGESRATTETSAEDQEHSTVSTKVEECTLNQKDGSINCEQESKVEQHAPTIEEVLVPKVEQEVQDSVKIDNPHTEELIQNIVQVVQVVQESTELKEDFEEVTQESSVKESVGAEDIEQTVSQEKEEEQQPEGWIDAWF